MNKAMVFIDGSNFLIELGRFFNIDIRAEKPPWSAILLANRFIA